MANSIDAMADTMVANMKDRTGKKLEQWLKIVSKLKLEKHMEIVKHLKSEHAVTHGFANMIAHHALNPPSQAGEKDLVATQYAGNKAGLLPIYEALLAAINALGQDVEVAPKKAYVSLRRKKQFAIIQPSTKERIDLGLNLKGHPTCPRLEASGSFNAMVSHRVRITKKADVDRELKNWLREAYAAAG